MLQKRHPSEVRNLDSTRKPVRLGAWNVLFRRDDVRLPPAVLELISLRVLIMAQSESQGGATFQSVNTSTYDLGVAVAVAD